MQELLSEAAFSRGERIVEIAVARQTRWWVDFSARGGVQLVLAAPEMHRGES